jgi:small subunit ribosomal protein S17
MLHGTIVSVSNRQTVVIQREYLQRVQKYNRYERRRSRVNAHLPPCIEAKEGDSASIAECRPLAKTVSFVVVQTKGVA